jgi:phosphonate transport system substrate-binding protein
MHRILYFWLSIATSFLALTPGFTAADDELLLGVHPYKSAKILKKSFSPFAKYLSQVTGQRVRVVIARDYQQHTSRIGENKLNIAYMGPVSYVQLVTQFGAKPILARLEINGSPTFQGHIISRSKGSIRSVADIKGKRFAFGNPASTMSHLVPRHMLWKAGINTSDLDAFAFLGNHTNVALAVLSGDYDAGAVKEAVFHKNKSRGLRSVAVTPQLSEHLFVARSNMPIAKRQRIQKAMLTMHQHAKGIEALHAIKKTITKLVPAEDGDYNNLRLILEELASIGVK